MAMCIQRLFLSAAVGLTTMAFPPGAWAGGRMGMMGARPQMMMSSNMMGRMNTGTMMNGTMMNGTMMNGTMMNGTMMNGTMMNGTMTTPFTNGFGFGNPGFGFPGMTSPWWWNRMGAYGGGYGGGGYGGGGYGGGYGGSGLQNLYADPYAPTNASTTSSKKRVKPDPVPMLTPEQERERVHQQELTWSRSELPENETTSATALNILLADLQRLQTRAPRGADVELDPAVLASINVVVGGTNGNIGVLKHDGRIPWPATLSGSDFDAERQRVDSSIAKAMDEASAGKAVNVQGLTDAMGNIQRRLATKIEEIPTPEYIRAKRLLSSLDDAVKALREPDAANYFNQVYAAKGQTVAQLVQYMSRADLRFAPAVAGDEAAYQLLHRALAEYDLAVRSQPAAKK